MNAVKTKDRITKTELGKLKSKLPNNSNIQQQKKVVESEQSKLNEMLQELKKNCSHRNMVRVFKEKEISSITTELIFSGVFCSDCHEFTPRIDMPGRRCDNCGGEMKFDGFYQAGQDMKGSIYKCKNCSHEERKT